MSFNTLSLIAAVFVFCALCQWMAWRVRLPPILFLLLTGLLVGPGLNLIDPEEFLGDLFFPFVSLSVAIILFEGSLTLKIKEIRGLHIVVRNMVSYGMALSWLITTLATKFIFSVSWEIATLFGAIMVVTGPTVVAPILRTVRPVSSVTNILKWESIVIDPIGASLAILVYEFIIIGGVQEAFGHTLISFIQLLIIGGLIGVLAGYLFGLCLRNYLIPEFLQNICTLGVVFSVYALADLIQAESGLVSVTVFGVWLANMRGVDLEHILAFKKTLSTLLISLLFIVLAARVNFTDLLQLGWGALFIFLVIQFLARPLNVLASTMFLKISPAEKSFMAWIGPRGIVAAAIASLFALKLEEYGFEGADLLVPLTFVVIISTVLLQSITAVPLARFLRVTLPEPEGFLIVGANKLARTIAAALLENNIKVMLTDSSKERIAEAEKAGIPTYRGNPLSEHAEYNLHLTGLGTLLTLSAHESENIAAAFHYRQEFGKRNIFSLPVSKGRGSALAESRPRIRGKELFNNEASYSHLLHMLDRGAEIKCASLEKKIDLNDFHEKYGKEAIALFAIDPENSAHCFHEEQLPSLDEGWKVLFLGNDHGSNKQ